MGCVASKAEPMRTPHALAEQRKHQRERFLRRRKEEERYCSCCVNAQRVVPEAELDTSTSCRSACSNASSCHAGSPFRCMHMVDLDSASMASLRNTLEGIDSSSSRRRRSMRKAAAASAGSTAAAANGAAFIQPSYRADASPPGNQDAGISSSCASASVSASSLQRKPSSHGNLFLHDAPTSHKNRNNNNSTNCSTHDTSSGRDWQQDDSDGSKELLYFPLDSASMLASYCDARSVCLATDDEATDDDKH